MPYVATRPAGISSTTRRTASTSSSLTVRTSSSAHGSEQSQLDHLLHGPQNLTRIDRDHGEVRVRQRLRFAFGQLRKLRFCNLLLITAGCDRFLRRTTPPPQATAPARAATASSPRTTTGSSPRVYGTVPQPRAATPSKRQRRSVYEPRPEKVKRGPRWHELDARSAQRTRPAAKTAYSRSVVAPPVPASRQIIRAVIVAIIVIALIALAAITIKHMLGSLIQPSAGAHIIEEVRTWQSPWPTV